MDRYSGCASYSELVAAKAAWDGDQSDANGKAWAIAKMKCRRELGEKYYLPDSLLDA